VGPVLCGTAEPGPGDMTSSRFLLLLLLFLVSRLAFARDKNASSGATPEMARLADALAGTWNNVETMEHTEFFPTGGERRGVSTCRLTTGGTGLLCEGDSEGSAGPLHHLIVIWWDQAAKAYGFFTCFREGKDSSCRVRGRAHWEGNDFVNDYSEDVDGKPVNMRDSFVNITRNSHTLVAAVEDSPGHMKTLITTKSTRQ
jgi:hypothetical protein